MAVYQCNQNMVSRVEKNSQWIPEDQGHRITTDILKVHFILNFLHKNDTKLGHLPKVKMLEMAIFFMVATLYPFLVEIINQIEYLK